MQSKKWMNLFLCFVFFQYKYQTSFNQDMFISDANVNEVLENVIQLNEFIIKKNNNYLLMSYQNFPLN